MDRKEFFNQAWKRLLSKGLSFMENNPMIQAIEAYSKKKQRPPGAASTEKEFQALCTGCDACMIACPINVIMIEDLEKRYPLLYPEEGPCLHCEGYPCIQACPTGALSTKNGTLLRLLED